MKIHLLFHCGYQVGGHMMKAHRRATIVTGSGVCIHVYDHDRRY